MTRKQIEDCARQYVGSPFKHQGREKGKACDCVGLPLMVGEELGLRDTLGNPFTRFDHLNYSPQPGDEIVLHICRQRLIEMPPGRMILPGDLLAIKNPRMACHVGIVTERNGYLSIVHALDLGPRLCRVVEHRLDDALHRRVRAVFNFPGVE